MSSEMKPLEAMQVLISEADGRMKVYREACDRLGENPDPENLEWLRRTELATSIIQAMLNNALPVVRFRCHVQVEKVGDKAKLGLGDFITSSTDIAGIKNGLIGLSREPVAIYASLWEQRATGADMLSGYQGATKTIGYRNWLADIDRFEGSNVEPQP